MSISITDVRRSRRNAMQNLRRGFNVRGEFFEQSPELFPTGKGYSPSQLEALYNYYEQFRGHRVSSDEFFDIGYFQIPTITEDEWYDEYEYQDYDYQDDIIDTSFIQQARDRVNAIGSDYANKMYEDFESHAMSYGVGMFEGFLEENQELFDDFLQTLSYAERSDIKKGDKGTEYMIYKAFEKLSDSFFRYSSR